MAKWLTAPQNMSPYKNYWMIHARTHKSYVFQEYLGQFFFVCSFAGPQMTQSQNKKNYQVPY